MICAVCNGAGVVQSDTATLSGTGQPIRVWTKCICVRKQLIQGKLGMYGDVRYKNPKKLLKYPRNVYIHGEWPLFKDRFAGYLLYTGELNFKALTVQHMLTLHFSNEPLTDLIYPEILVLDFTGLVGNKLLPLLLMQLFEERNRYANKKTWVLSPYEKETLFSRFSTKETRDAQDAQDTLNKFLESLSLKHLIKPQADSAGVNRVAAAYGSLNSQEEEPELVGASA